MTEVQQPKRGRGRPKGSGRHPYSLGPRAAAAVAAYLRCGDQRQALRESGYAATYSQFFKVPAVIAAIDSARRAVAVKAEYNLESAMTAMDNAALFARETGNATALVRAEELKAKLAGLMVDRVDARQVGAFQLVFADLNGPPKTVDAAAAASAKTMLNAAAAAMPSHDPFEGL
jgi:hypothetical protein